MGFLVKKVGSNMSAGCCTPSWYIRTARSIDRGITSFCCASGLPGGTGGGGTGGGTGGAEKRGKTRRRDRVGRGDCAAPLEAACTLKMSNS